ncbi:MAG TPA: DNA polymerase IV, partial [Clostridia bacterium]|nr:DNA polymerase IV [Clostridia bacterium]
METIILHADLNSFYASVECLYNPAIRNLPVAVCGSVENRHGIVLAKNQQ